MRLGVVFVHGIGREHPGWANQTIARLSRSVHEQLRALQPSAQLPPPEELLIADSVSWDHLFRQRQQLLAQILQATSEPAAEPEGWLQRIQAWLLRKARQAQATLVTEFIGDIIGYLGAENRRAVQEEMTATLDRMAGRCAAHEGRAPLTIIAHSLGTVIASEYVWDLRKRRASSNADGFHPAWELANFFTLGSPLALFSLKFGGAEAFRDPIRLDAASGRWINILNPRDPVGMPLRTLNEEYAAVIHADLLVRGGKYLQCHLEYLQHAKVLRVIAEKLAVDWLALNAALPENRLRQLAAAYDATLRASV